MFRFKFLKEIIKLPYVPPTAVIKQEHFIDLQVLRISQRYE